MQGANGDEKRARDTGPDTATMVSPTPAINGGFIYTSSQGNTTTGTAGYLYGAQQSAIELDYAGNGIFIPLSHEGTIRAF